MEYSYYVTYIEQRETQYLGTMFISRDSPIETLNDIIRIEGMIAERLSRETGSDLPKITLFTWKRMN